MPITFEGLVPAVFTPMHNDGQLNLDAVGPYVELLIDAGVAGMLPCGTTGEFPSLSLAERCEVAEAFIETAAGRVPVVVHVGHTHLEGAQRLAAHAASVGASAIAAAPPHFLKPPDESAVVDWCAELASDAPETPFFYYHIPCMTGVEISVLEFLRQAIDRIPTLAGVKYTYEALDEYALCVEEFAGRLQILFGRDEMLLAGLASGATGAIGSSYSFSAPLYNKLWQAFNDGDLAAARGYQCQSVRLINLLKGFTYPAASKACVKLLGVDLGPPRMPLRALTADQAAALPKALDAAGFPFK